MAEERLVAFVLEAAGLGAGAVLYSPFKMSRADLRRWGGKAACPCIFYVNGRETGQGDFSPSGYLLRVIISFVFI